jgi:hypothetical protein
MREKRSGQDRRSGVNHLLFFDRRSGKDRRSNLDPARRNPRFRKRDTERNKEQDYQIKPNLPSSRV